MRLIDADALERHVYTEWVNGELSNSEWVDFRQWLKDEPTVEPASPWHRCEERLPDDTFKQVLITDGTHFGLAYCLDLGVYGVKWRKTNWMSIGGLFRGKITHWMPIEPPKEDA